MNRGDELRADLDTAGPDLREAALIWCQARALVAAAMAEDALPRPRPCSPLFAHEIFFG